MPTSSGRAWYTDGMVWTMLFTAWIFLFSGAFQLFPQPGWTDAGIYQGYGFNLPALVRRYGFTRERYHGSRLSYVLILYFCHRLASSVAAQYLQLLFFHGITIVSIVALGYRQFGRGPTLLGAAFLAFNPLFLSAFTFGGADGPALAYVSLAAAILFSVPGMGGDHRAMAACGFVSAAACAANPFAIAPMTGFLAAGLLAAPSKRSRLSGYLAFLVGGVLALVLLGLIGRAFGLEFFFPKYSFGMTRSLAQGFGSVYLRPLEDWLFVNYRLLVPVILGGSALAMLSVRPELRRDRVFLGATCVAPVLPFALFLYANLSGRAQLVQARHYSTLLLPGLALSVFALCRAVRVDDRRVLGLALLLGLPAGLVAAGLVPVNPLATEHRGTFWALLGLGVLLTIPLLLSRPRASTARWTVISAVLLSAVCFSLSQDSLQVYRVSTSDDYKEVFLGAHHLVRVLEESGIAERRPLFWFPRDAENTRSGLASTFRLNYRGQVTHLNYFDTLVSFYLWSPSLLGTSMSSLQAGALEKHDGRPIVLLAPTAELCQRALARVRSLGYRVSETRWIQHSSRRFGWVAVAIEVVAPDAAEGRAGRAWLVDRS